MRFSEIKRYVKDSGIGDYLVNTLGPGIRELFVGLGNLTFADNFKTFLWEGTIEAGATELINHELGTVPVGFLIIFQIGNVVVDASDNQWTTTEVWLRNNGVAPVTLKVFFFK